MQGYNKATICGNVARLELKYTRNGKPYCRFTIATNSRWKNLDGEWTDNPQFHSCTAWGRPAEVISEFVAVGDPLLVEGAIEYSERDGKWYTNINVREYVLLGRKSDSGSKSAGKRDNSRSSKPDGYSAERSTKVTSDDPFDLDEDDLPF